MIDNKLISFFEQELASQTKILWGASPLYSALQYALFSGGRRFRPALVLAIGGSSALHGAMAVEFFHTASLIADDLPCMDNDTLRRGQPTLHLQFGETKALLASYALIAAGYEMVAKNGREISSDVCLEALEVAATNTGVWGATGGQYEDLFPGEKSEEALLETLRKKTASLFEIAFVFGWLFGGGAISLLPLVKQASNHYGMAFQIADDLKDYGEKRTNLAESLGLERAKELFHVELSAFSRLADEISLPVLQDFAYILRKQVLDGAGCPHI